MRSEDIAYANKYSDDVVSKCNIKQLEDEMKALSYPPSIQCIVMYKERPDICGEELKTEEIKLTIRGSSKGELSFPVKVVEVKGK